MKGGQNHFVPLFVFVTFAAKLISPINLNPKQYNYVNNNRYNP